jgi:hypothetical protein
MVNCVYEPWLLKDLALALSDLHVGSRQIVVPMFQRGKRWGKSQEEAFIDSLKKGYPIGTMLFYRKIEKNKDIYILVDGLQRGSTIKKFMSSPTKYFTNNDVSSDIVDEIYNVLRLSGEERIIKNGIVNIIVDAIHSKSTFSGMQFYPIAKDIVIAFPTSNQNVIDQILEILDPLLISHQAIFEKIAHTTIPTIVYTGDEDTLPDIFDRINSKGTPLSTYEVYAASWPINNRFRVNNSKVVERVLRKYDSLADNDLFIAGYDRNTMRTKQELNAFEYVFGLSRFLNDKYTFLNFDKTSDDDVINPMAFELINACLNDSNDSIKSLYNNILSLDINLFEDKLIETIEFIARIIKPITRFKGNKRGSEKILHSKYQILSIISTTFKEHYYINNSFQSKKTWQESKNLLMKNVLQHYVYDIITSEWSDGGTSKIHKVGKTNKYLLPIPFKRWEATLNSYFEQVSDRQETKKIANPSKEDVAILNCIYLPLFTALDQLSIENFDIEHIATKEQMKHKITDCHGLGLPISNIANLCYLPQKVNRSKKDKTFYQDKNYLKHINLPEIESKYSFTEESDLEWLEITYTEGDFAVLKDNYMSYLKKRFNKQKEMFYNSFGIEYDNDVAIEDTEKSDFDDDSTIPPGNAVERNGENKVRSAFHHLCAKSINSALNIALHKVDRILYATEDNDIGVIIAVSKSYQKGNKEKFWFAYHPHYRDTLDKYKNKYIAFGCGSEKNTLLISLHEIESKKIRMNHTIKGDRIYWHVVLYRDQNNNWTWLLSKPELEEINISDKLI